VTWTFLPVIETGNDQIESYTGDLPANLNRSFWRLRGIDLTAADPYDADYDGDTLKNGVELTLGTDPLKADTDDDGANDALEIALGTDPHRRDTDGDGAPDGWEALYNLDPLDPGDALQDADGDGWSNLAEYLVGRNPRKGALPDTAGTIAFRIYTPAR
jgi:hypothetical protein